VTTGKGCYAEALAALAQGRRDIPHDGLPNFSVAIADFNAGLRLIPTDPEMLYGRGLAKQKNGDKTGGDDDIAAAKSIKANIVEVIARMYELN
jgi:hypothetical protein